MRKSRCVATVIVGLAAASTVGVIAATQAQVASAPKPAPKVVPYDSSLVEASVKMLTDRALAASDPKRVLTQTRSLDLVPGVRLSRTQADINVRMSELAIERNKVNNQSGEHLGAPVIQYQVSSAEERNGCTELWGRELADMQILNVTDQVANYGWGADHVMIFCPAADGQLELTRDVQLESSGALLDMHSDQFVDNDNNYQQRDAAQNMGDVKE